MRWAEVPDGVIPLTAADHDEKIDTKITEALIAEISHGHFPYSPPQGLVTFREAVVQHFSKTKETSLSNEQILACNSAASAIQHFYDSILAPGDEVLIQDPVDFLLGYCAERAGGVVRRIPTQIPSGQISVVEGWQSCVNEKTKVLVICHPHNPLGFYYDRNQLEEISAFASRNNLILFSDEVWSDVVFKDNFISMKAIHPKAWVVYGLSKGFGLAGLRIGALISPDADGLKKVMNVAGYDRTIEGTSTLSQMAAVAAMESSSGLKSFLVQTKNVMEMAVKSLNTIPIFETRMPESTFVLWIAHDKALDSIKLAASIEEEAKVKLVPGLPMWFGPGAKDHLRMSCATHPEIMQDALNRIQIWAKRHQENNDFHLLAK